MSKKLNKRKYNTLLSGRDNYYTVGGNMLTTVGKDPEGAILEYTNQLAQSLGNIAQMNHTKFMQQQQDQANDYSRELQGREIAENNQAALAQAKETRLQQAEDMRNQAQNTFFQPKMLAIGGGMNIIDNIGSNFGTPNFSNLNITPGIKAYSGNGYNPYRDPVYAATRINAINNSSIETPTASLPMQNSLKSFISNPSASLYKFPTTNTANTSVEQSPADNKVSNSTGNSSSGIVGTALALSRGVGQLIGGDYHSGVGDVVQNIPGLEIAGGLYNRLLGLKTNRFEVNRVKNDIMSLANDAGRAGAATSFDDTSLSGPTEVDFNVKAYKGLHSGKKNAALEQDLRDAYAFAERATNDAITNIGSNQAANLQANYSALGGPLYYADGGGIHIAPSKRGTFTAAATKHGKSVQEFASQVLANKDNYSPAMVKKANFARNASKWHAFGGDLMTQGSDFDTGIITIGNGGSHEQNPYGGVPIGVDQEGVPNLVEAGEVVKKDDGKPSRVYTDRILIPKDDEVRKLVKLPKGKLTYADAVKHIEKYYDGRIDPISIRGKEAELNRLYESQENLKLKRQMAQRQKRSMNGINQANQFKGGGGLTQVTQQDIDAMVQSWVDENDREFRAQVNPIKSTRLDLRSMSPEERDKVVLGMDKKESDAFWNRPQSSLTQSQINRLKSLNDPNNRAVKDKYYATWLRYMPALGSALNVTSDLLGWTNKPDMSYSDMVLKASQMPYVKAPVLGNYLTYRPLDRNYYLNSANAAAGAARRALLNTAGANRGTAMAGLIASDYNNVGSVGDMLMKQDLANFDREYKIASYNRETDSANAGYSVDAQKANQQAQEARLKGVMSAAELAQQEEDTTRANRATNQTAFWQNLGNLGIDEANRRDAAKRIETYGSTTLDDLYTLYSADKATRLALNRGYTRKELVDAGYIKQAAKGGKLRTRTKRGFTI